MTGDAPHGFTEQAQAGWNAMPGRGAGGMRERDKIEGAALVANGKRAANYFVEFFERKKLRDGEFADGDDQLGSQEIDLVVHPGRAIPNLIRRGNAIAAGRRFSGEATTNGGEINLRAHLFLGDSAELLKPAEECATRGPRKRFAEHGLFHAGCLADEHDFADDGTA